MFGRWRKRDQGKRPSIRFDVAKLQDIIWVEWGLTRPITISWVDSVPMGDDPYIQGLHVSGAHADKTDHHLIYLLRDSRAPVSVLLTTLAHELEHAAQAEAAGPVAWRKQWEEEVKTPYWDRPSEVGAREGAARHWRALKAAVK